MGNKELCPSASKNLYKIFVPLKNMFIIICTEKPTVLLLTWLQECKDRGCLDVVLFGNYRLVHCFWKMVTARLLWWCHRCAHQHQSVSVTFTMMLT